MNEKMQYASMLEMPFSTANVTVAPSKKRKRKTKSVNTETVKQELIQKVNAEEALAEYSPALHENEYYNQNQEQEFAQENYEQAQAISALPEENKKPRKFKLSVIAVQIFIIGALIATILYTNATNPNSGINAFFKEVFTTTEQVETVDKRLHSEFAPVIAYGEDEFVLQDGVMTLNSAGSIYSPCDGVITSVAVDGNGRYSIEIEHSTNFKSRLTGLDFIYAEQGDSVFSNIPVGYMKGEGATVCFTGADGSIISDYQIVDNSVVWAV